MLQASIGIYYANAFGCSAMRADDPVHMGCLDGGACYWDVHISKLAKAMSDVKAHRLVLSGIVWCVLPSLMAAAAGPAG